MSTPSAAPAWACRLNMLLMRIQLISCNNARRLASRVITRRSILHALWDNFCFPSGFPAYRSLWLIERLSVPLESATEHYGRLQCPFEDVLSTRFSQPLCDSPLHLFFCRVRAFAVRLMLTLHYFAPYKIRWMNFSGLRLYELHRIHASTGNRSILIPFGFVTQCHILFLEIWRPASLFVAAATAAYIMSSLMMLHFCMPFLVKAMCCDVQRITIALFLFCNCLLARVY